MGLDMYLEANFFVGGGYPYMREDAGNTSAARVIHQFDTILHTLGTSTGALRKANPEAGNYLNVFVEVAYWRKANAIHAWFGRQLPLECGQGHATLVERGHLKQLIADCRTVLDTVNVNSSDAQRWHAADLAPYSQVTFDRELAAKLLPTQAGSFFGDTTYDQNYLNQLRRTVWQIGAVLDNPAFEHNELYYHASW